MLRVLGSSAGRQGLWVGALGMLALLLATATGYWLGSQERRQVSLLDLQPIAASATGTNMAVATGQVSEEAEGVFFLDFLTGDLQCLVYYPRSGAFGARYYTNVHAQMPTQGKNGEYLMVTGAALSTRTSSNVRPANCLVYVTDVSSGTFAAYAVPWNKSAESSSQAQGGPLIFVGGGPIRNFQLADVPKKAAPIGKAPAANDPKP